MGRVNSGPNSVLRRLLDCVDRMTMHYHAHSLHLLLPPANSQRIAVLIVRGQDGHPLCSLGLWVPEDSMLLMLLS